jgi:hypothetical protein
MRAFPCSYTLADITCELALKTGRKSCQRHVGDTQLCLRYHTERKGLQAPVPRRRRVAVRWNSGMGPDIVASLGGHTAHCVLRQRLLALGRRIERRRWFGGILLETVGMMTGV